jgi:hydroxymethylpyrimidine pyrophosphatase-like HAD family hydrolase
MTSEELGRVTFTSKSTVIRLCKKLNVLSYQELKKVLYSELNEERIFGKEDAYPTLNNKSTNREISDLLQQVYKKTIDEVNLLNNQIIINRIMNQIIKMEKIEFYSTGIGYSVLETVSHKFNSIMRNCGEQMIRVIAVDMDEVMAIGDSMNDYSMLSMEFGATVAMENGMPEVKKVAKYITKSNEELGVAHAIELALNNSLHLIEKCNYRERTTSSGYGYKSNICL